jgi:AcrR family transcriptional regulator
MPTAREIAARAAVSERTVFVHFADLEALRSAGALRQASRWRAFAEPVDRAWPLERRVDALPAQRERSPATARRSSAPTGSVRR